MSTLRVNTLQNTAGTGQPAMVGAAKAWVNFNGTGTVAIRAAFNVSSITDNGTGDYTVNFTNAMVDTNYCVTGTSGSAGNAPASLGSLALNTTSVQVLTNQHNSGAVDRTFDMVAIFR